MRVARVQAQAKLNLVLRVGARAGDGYHDISTVFQRIDLADEITVRVGGAARTLDVAGPRVPAAGMGAPDRNLAFRAAVAYAERCDWLRGFAIELTKHVPVGGGLGGGSADAAAVLRILDALAPAPLGVPALKEIGNALGADVPFLTTDLPVALAGGRGDRLTAVEPLEPRAVALVVPPFPVSTTDAYRWLDESRQDQPTAPIALPLGGWGWDYVERQSRNDFEAVVESRHPELTAFRRQLVDLGARISRLSGSGSTVFGIFALPYQPPRTLAGNAVVLESATSARVVQVEVQE